MKKNIIRICILSLILTIVSSFIIITFGKTYTVNFNLEKNKEYNLTIENKSGEIEILEENKDNNNYKIKVKAKKKGQVYISLEYDDYTETSFLYVHKTMFITNNSFFGKSTGSEVIPISLSIILTYILYLLIKEYKRSIKENLYQYKNIAYLGIIFFISFFNLSNILSIYHYQGLFQTISKIIASIASLAILLFPIAFITSILVTISNIRLIKKEGKSLRNLLGLFLGIFICILTLLPDQIYKILMRTQAVNIYDLNSIGPYLYNFIETLIYLSVTYLECILIGTIVIAIKSIKKKVDYDKDYIIILGCKIKNDGSLTPLLKGRVDKAITFRNEQLKQTGKDLILIPSGGKGKDEIISEAEAMKKYLLEQGIKDKNIIVENKSKNTYENIKFSNKLIKEKDSNICFATTNYHILRAGLIATEQGLKIEGIGSKTKIYFLINAFIREFIGTIYSEKKKHIMVLIIIIISLIVMIGITYLGNNI